MSAPFLLGSWQLQHDQAVFLASWNTSLLTSANEDSTCGGIWDPVNARFTSCAIRYIYLLPLTIGVLCFLTLAGGRLSSAKLPIWLRNFVSEETHHSSSLLTPPLSNAFPYFLACTASVGLTCSVASCIINRDSWFILAAEGLSWAVLLAVIVLERPRTIPPAVLSISMALLAAGAAFASTDHPVSIETGFRIANTLLALMLIIACLLMPMRNPRLSTEGISKVYESPSSKQRSPEDRLAMWQWMTVSWMIPLVSLGRKRQLEDEDVWKLPFDFQHLRLYLGFRELHGTVFMRLLKANCIDLILTTTLGILELIADISSPVLLQQFLRSMGDPTAPKTAPIVYATLILIVRLCSAQLDVFALWYSRRSYERSRGEMITMLYEKALSRKVIGEQKKPADDVEGKEAGKDAKDEKKESASSGKLLNLMRNDAYEVAQRFWEWQDLVTKPLGVFVSAAMVWVILGWPCLLGASVVLVAIGLDLLITRVLIRLEKKRRSITDDKLKLISQFVEAIRHLRYNSWEQKWLQQILEQRDKELWMRVVTRSLSILITVINDLAHWLFPALSFLAYTLIAKRPLRVEIAFPALQLFNLLERYLQNIPNLIQTILNAKVAMDRLETFMKEPEQDSSDDRLLQDDVVPLLNMENCSFAWPGKEEPTLKDVTLTLPSGLNVVRGEVGAGKSALLQALLGEMDQSSGIYRRPSSVMAYCAQTPWLQNMSIRDNILFSTPYDPDRYKAVITACCLIQDLSSFKNGDLSFVGENGIGLSGGQKARVALARAVYSESPFLLLDDPISALDQETADAIMKGCIAGPLCRDRITVLVTHRLDLCKGLAKQILNVGNGMVSVAEDVSSLFEDEETSSSSSTSEGSSSSRPEPNFKAQEDNTDDAIKDKFIEEEKRAHGGVKPRVYWIYIKSGSLKLWALLIFAVVSYRLFSITESWFLKAWGEAYDRQSALSFPFTISDPFAKLPSPEKDIRPWITGFFVLAACSIVVATLVPISLTLIIYSAGKRMFREVMTCVSNATFRFYDLTPVGRLMNRMTSDIGVIDGNIHWQLMVVAWMVISWVSSILVIASVTPTFLLCGVVITLLFFFVFFQFLPTSQSLRRLEMTSLTPLMANFGVLTDGLLTIRAYRAQKRFHQKVIEVVDTFQKMDHFYWSLQAWMMYRFDTLAAVSTFILSILAIFTNLSEGLTAFSLIAAQSFVMSTHSLCRVYGNMEMDFTSVERVVELLEIEQEEKGDIEPPAAWPTAGEIELDHVNIRYGEGLDLVLKDVSLRIPGGSNVAVIGRTGSGKSTLALSLLTVVRPASGKIILDNVDICTIDPRELRKRITFLAQDPTLFAGSMRENLDPLVEFSDEEVVSVIQRLGARYEWSMDTRVEAGGKNLSQGQRQLVQLARAILRRSKLVILDEATASIDVGTSREVQDILRQEMVNSTLITIAHRVEAVNNADWYIELADGRVVSQGRPLDLKKPVAES